MEFISAATKNDVLEALSSMGEDAVILAGGTDVMIQYLRGEIAPAHLLHIENVGELRSIAETSDRISLGALTVHRDLTTDARIADRLPALAEAAGSVGGWQTQSIGTVAGNICNASPAADLVAPLLIADAVVNLESSTHARSLLLSDFLIDRRKTARRDDELVTSVEAVPRPERAGEVYLKVGRRSAMEVALVGLAVRILLDGNGNAEDVSIAVCSVSPVPYRATEVEKVIRAGGLHPEAVKEAGHVLTESARPITDARADASYRRRILGPLLQRALEIAVERAAA
jgi:carbon-monoxide dehydrogenase medium subunit